MYYQLTLHVVSLQDQTNLFYFSEDRQSSKANREHFSTYSPTDETFTSAHHFFFGKIHDFL